jgi:hypothetical protein
MDYYSYKKIYTGGDMFTLSGADFKGLLQYKDGKVTTVETNELLTPKPTYDTDLLTSRIFRDRTVEELNINLPVIRSECVFGLNETFNYNTLKFKLDNIRKNNVFVYSRSFIASNSLPYSDNITYAGLSTLESSNFTVYNVNRDDPAVNATAVFSDSTNYSALGDVFDTTAQTNYEFKDRFAFFCVTNSSFISITGSSDSLGVAEESTMYESTTANNLEFGELGGITSNKSTVFISDKGNNTILKYNVSGYLNNDSALTNTRYLLKVLGGEGNIERRSNFNEPTILTCNDEYVAVYDSGNKCIKMFTTDFEYVTTFTILNLKKERRGTETIGAMEFDPDFKSLYVITTSDDGEMFLYRKNVITSKSERVVLDEKLDVTSGEVLKSIAFSTVDSNYWYICTDRKIYKKYKTIPQYEIGYFDENRLFDFVGSSGVIENRWNYQDSKWRDSNFNWNLNLGTSGGSGSGSTTQQQKFRGVSMSLGDDGQDKILMFSGNRVYFFNEPTAIAYQKVLKQFNYENYGINGFSLKPDEYIQVPVINSELYKVVYDMLVLKNNLVGRFAGQYTDDILRLGSYNYNIDLSELKGDNVEDFFLHHNEEGILGAINRTLSEIYDIQLKLVNLTSVDVGSVVQRGDRYITNSLCAVSGVDAPENINIVKTASLLSTYNGSTGEYIRYSITVSNDGDETVSFITLVDSITDRVNVDDSYNILDTSFVLSPNQTAIATYDYLIIPSDVAAGRVDNTVTVNFSGQTRSDSVTVFGDSSLVVTKQVTSPNPYYTGADAAYEVTVLNSGLNTAANINLLDDLAPITVVSDPAGLFSGSGTLNVGEQATATYTYTTQQIGTLYNTVTAQSDIGDFISNEVEIEVIDCTAGMDVVFAIDYTASIADIFDEIVNNIQTVVSEIDNQSGGNYRLSLVTVDEHQRATLAESSALFSNRTFYTVNGVYNSLPSDQKTWEYDVEGSAAWGSDTWDVFTTWEKLNNTDNSTSFINSLNAARDDFAGAGNISIPADGSLKKIIDDNFAGTFRTDVSRYVIFITDTNVGENNVVYSHNSRIMAEVEQSAIDKGIKVFILGPGVNDPGTLIGGGGVSSNFTLFPADPLSVAAYRSIAENTGGAWSVSADPNTIKTLLIESCSS